MDVEVERGTEKMRGKRGPFLGHSDTSSSNDGDSEWKERE
jgi:hypothetical protein